MRDGFVVGGCWTLDRIKRVDRWPEQEALAFIDDIDRLGGGSAHNLGIDMRRLASSMSVEAIGLLGQDADGDFLIKRAEQEGISVTQLHRTHAASTSFTDVMTVADTGRRTFFHHAGSNDLLSPDHFDLSACRGRILHLGLLGLHRIMDEPWQSDANGWVNVLAEAQRIGMQTNLELVSIASDRIHAIAWPCIEYVSTLICNDHEIGGLAQIETFADGVTDVRACIEAARLVMQQGSMSCVVVHFPAGAVAVDVSGELFEVPSTQIASADVVGAVGAGDAFAAGVLYGIHEHWPLPRSIELGHATAAASLRALDAVSSVGSVAENLGFAGVAQAFP